MTAMEECWHFFSHVLVYVVLLCCVVVSGRVVCAVLGLFKECGSAVFPALGVELSLPSLPLGVLGSGGEEEEACVYSVLSR